VINYSPGHLINVAQCAKDQGMFESWERDLLEQTAIMLLNRQDISSNQEEQVVRIISESVRFNLPIYNREVDSLSIATLAAFNMPANLRSHLLENEGNCTIGILRKTGFKHAPTGRLNSLLQTDQNRRQLQNGLSTLESNMMSWRKDIRRDIRAKWILPEEYLSSSLSLECIENDEEIESLIILTPIYNYLVKLPTTTRWLPFLSIEFIREIKRCNSDDYHLIKEILLTISAKYFNGNINGPWEKEFFDELGVLPLYWLYQYKPTYKTRTLIQKLVRSYCTNIGHLVPFQSEVFALIKSTAIEDWYSLMLRFSPQI